ncbi:YfhO family protein [Salinimicrobium oceani]|uniref:YfhO family protein n=1 Tax=Salinimicrobium oceani TaxID=2722702 RepID=A0ABX1CSU2_9FLAO|nr:YfhO family protein [Salinimicrobium oceani]NJW51378.1 YfhO family protein [Salinimicrobium oceani]
MRNFRIISVLSILTSISAAIAAAAGIFYTNGGEPYFYESIRGKEVEIYGRGLYQHMSADVAIQGIAHDYVTLFIAVPVLLVSLYFLKRGKLKAVLFHAGILHFFFLTYLFYMNMGMYNTLFLLYVLITSLSFFALAITLFEVRFSGLKEKFHTDLSRKLIGGFLMFLSIAIALLWLEIIITPLLDGSIFPAAVAHYTSLTVQGLDLSLFLPLAFVSGLLLWKNKDLGYMMSAVTLIFLCFLLTALVAKIVAMAMTGVNVVPVVFIMPTALVLTLLFSFLLFRKIRSGTAAGAQTSSSIQTGA